MMKNFFFVSLISVQSFGNNELCLKPINQLQADFRNLLNEETKNQELSGRYLIADLEIKDSKGKCLNKGYEEVLPQDSLGLSFQTPMKIKGTSNGCAGQSMILCEVNSLNEVKLVARFALSAVSPKYISNYRDYYAPVNRINTRHGDARKRTSDMKVKDEFMGGGDEKLLKFEGTDPMYNFLNFVPTLGFKGETQNGIHRYPGGGEPKLGSPASHGCIRLSRNGSRYVREWSAIGAKFFIIHPSIRKINP